MKERLNIDYDFLIAGTSNKNDASKKLPMLNKIMSFPTSIFIDKKETFVKFILVSLAQQQVIII
jgi:hypothetical protein